ncbi:tetraspanin-31-A isoform X1 [Drosophila miranda]|uniref:Tetraspanin-31-A n=1 Tax=Drosophila pseudoobscura pseudoobscura TaxID=46245 RepID=A0A6I8UMX1_DROPS|nr:tetraspanin-31-A [Drosophila pseudoobscura]XP_017144325.1 tetraspanin-31-A isoform X1 [Drosophila miranda]XP_026841041.1 tetraspanin-31-A [Drosophila persimilis]
MCGGFTCSKNALIALNILYVMIGFLLIGVGVYARAASIVTNLPIVGGILACGVILICISMLGLAGAVKHHQVMLFFYMIILFMLFLIQFSIASSCLAVNSEQQQQFAEQGWMTVPPELRQQVQESLHCCGFNATSSINLPTSPLAPTDEPSCELVNRKCCEQSNDVDCHCPACGPMLEDKIDYAFKLCGGLGIFFSFTEVLAVFLARRYRNQHDPCYLPARAVFPHNYLY